MAHQISNKDLFVGGLAKSLKKELLPDLRLKAKNDSASISVHKIVLSSRSEGFKKLLVESDENMEETDEFKSWDELETITLSDFDEFEELEALIGFIYSDGSALSANAMKHVRSLYVAAEKFMIPHLRDLCRDQLQSILSPSNALGILELAQIPLDDALHTAAFNMVTTNMSTISKTDEFKLFMEKHRNLALEVVKTSSNRNKGCFGYCVIS